MRQLRRARSSLQLRAARHFVAGREVIAERALPADVRARAVQVARGQPARDSLCHTRAAAAAVISRVRFGDGGPGS